MSNEFLIAGKRIDSSELRSAKTNDGHLASRRAGSVEAVERERQHAALLARLGRWPNYVKLGRLVRYDAAALENFIGRNLRVSKARATTEEQRVAH
jgi:hypothetical protein